MPSSDKIPDSRVKELIIIAAVAKNNVIGFRSKIPWYLKQDMVRFKKLTMGYPVIMGRKTFETLPVKPLPGRVNVVVTGNKGLSYAGCVMRGSLSEAVDYCRGYDKIFVVGGQNIYEQAMKLADRIELTRIDREYDGDAFFPAIDPGKWKLEKKEENDGFSFESYVRKK